MLVKILLKALIISSFIQLIFIQDQLVSTQRNRIIIFHSFKVTNSYKFLLLFIQIIREMGPIQSICGDSEARQKDRKIIKDLQRQKRKKEVVEKDLKEEIYRLERQLDDQRKKKQKQQLSSETKISEPKREQQSLKGQNNYTGESINTAAKEEDLQKQKLTKLIKDYEARIAAYEKSIKQNDQDKGKEQLKRQIKQYESKIAEFQKLKLKAQKDQVSQKQQLTNLISDYESKIQELKRLIAQKDKQTQQLEESLKQIQERDNELQKKQEDLQKVICSLRDQLEAIRLKEEKEQQRYQKLILQLNQKISTIAAEKESINSEISRAKDELSLKEQKLHQTSKQSEEENKWRAEQMRRSFEKYEANLREKDQRIQKLHEQLSILQRKKQSDVSQQKEHPSNGLKQKLDQYISELDRVRLSRNRMSRAVAEMKFNNFFNAELLQEQSDYKQFLVNTIQSRMQKKITKTKLVYKYDELNKINIHKYIDNKYFLVLVVKLENGYYLAAFTEGPFYPKMESKYDGLIISLTNRKVFTPVIPNKRAIAYDDFFVIFGNSQVRLKSQEKKIFSNFAISNGYFNANGEKVSVLLGAGATREVPLESYEFYELTFKS